MFLSSIRPAILRWLSTKDENMDAGITQVSADIVQVRMPLPYALNLVNCYLLRGDSGWTLLDTGLNTPAGRDQWARAMRALGIQARDIEKIVLTHMHPDHFGLAGWWQRQADQPLPVYLPEGERAMAQVFYASENENSPRFHQWMLDCGLPPATVQRIEAALASTGDLTRPHPIAEQTLRAGTMARLGGRSFRAIHAPGHSDGQLIFYDEADRLLLSGDHVLMRITPNIGSWPHTQPDPLGRYLRSLRELAALDVRLALPGHDSLIHDWRGRINELLAHHEVRLGDTLAALAAGAETVYEVAARLFKLERLSAHEWRFALAEALAHLQYLRPRERAACDCDGLMRWRAL
ncbi:MAG: MBL fold metallo-hydrolase [Chloroflexi bacterium]|nr:MBL fold metallo-hydrolase [Chloroflexota bacterium]MXX51376.1 MBL fold metallo-hydrolase [Chloroflexota bacterium]MXX82126.1 MBL fold metallo-hydrolase [Chloroflexota bacterium]MYA92057.1 MBL fold metallo-hydrolase [Chloroflexota bacterium]MYC54843.1 MBL fold metallo-hydrolase [Chloroflexota bacterium]